jgi:hypothetical protein
MEFIHMLRNSGPAGEFHLAMMMKGAQEREAEERKQAKAAKWVAVKAKKVAEAKRKSDSADAAKAAADKTAATGAVAGKEGSDPSLTLAAVSKATAFSTGVKLPDLIPVNGSGAALGTGASQSVFSSTPAAGSSAKGKGAKASWVPKGRRSSDAAVTHKGRKYNAARPMPQTSYVPSPAPLLSSVGTEPISIQDTPAPPLALLFPPSVSDATANPDSLKSPSDDAILSSSIDTHTPHTCQGSKSPTADSIDPIDMMSFTASISATPLTPLRLSMDEGPRAVTVAGVAPADHLPSASSATATAVTPFLSGKSDGEAALTPAPALPAPPLCTTDPSSEGTSFIASTSASALNTALAVPAAASASHMASSAILPTRDGEGGIEVEKEAEAVVTSNGAEAVLGGGIAPAVPGVSRMDSAKGIQPGVRSDSGSGSVSGLDATECVGEARAREAVGTSIEGGQQVLVASPSPTVLTEMAVTAQSAVVCFDTVHSPSTVSVNATSVQCVAASEISSASAMLHSLPLPSSLLPPPAVVVSDTPQSESVAPEPVPPSKGSGGCTQQ